MHGTLQNLGKIDEDTSVLIGGGYVPARENYFAEMAKGVFAQKAGMALSLATGVDERSCRRYAAGHVQPSAVFLVNCLRGPYGRQILNWSMTGANSVWWEERERAFRKIQEQMQILNLK